MQLSPERAANKAVGYWVLAGTAMLVVQVMLGGITRLTGSGLSITEWNVVTGFVPPIGEHAWNQAFANYQATPQFRLLNSGFGLREFKFIFFWEWFHRFWARLVGVVFVVGFVILMYKRLIRTGMIRPLLLLFLLGAAQGLIGWIMVLSGLTGDATYVQPTKLALHFIFALVLIAAAFWYALTLLRPELRSSISRRSRRWVMALLAVLFLQLLFGALMAGSKAAAAAPTWPSINGDWVPATLFAERPFLVNFIGNPMMIHFIHRWLAYGLFVAVLLWFIQSARSSRLPAAYREAVRIPAILITVQIGLGIGSVLTSSGIVANRWKLFDWFALVHQLTGMLFLLSLVYILFLTRSGRTR